MSNAWLRALVVCDDVRFELGGGVTLVGVYADQILASRTGDTEAPPSESSIVFPRFGIYAVIAGLRGATELRWHMRLLYDGSPLDGPPMMEGTEAHDAEADEHRLVSLLSPLAFPRPGRYCLSLTFETARDRRSVDHHFTIAFAP